jgi:hypothetical protein
MANPVVVWSPDGLASQQGDIQAVYMGAEIVEVAERRHVSVSEGTNRRIENA